MKRRYVLEFEAYGTVEYTDDAAAINGATNFYAQNMRDEGLTVNRIRIIDVSAPDSTGRVVPLEREVTCKRCKMPKGKHLIVHSADRDYANDEWLMCPDGRYKPT